MRAAGGCVRFVVDADLPRLTAELLRRHGHEAQDVRDIGLGSASDRLIADHALKTHSIILTGDFGFADVRNYPPVEYDGIVVVEVPNRATAPGILELIEYFLKHSPAETELIGKLVVVEWGRIHVR